VLVLRFVRAENVFVQVTHFVALPALTLHLTHKTADLACPIDNFCVNSECVNVECVVDSNCGNDALYNTETGEYTPAAGKCIDNVCYLCIDKCLSQKDCFAYEYTGGGAPALCMTDPSCISRDDGETKSSSFTDGVPLWHQVSPSFI
ncbi:6754_t:CDS:2, partial [Diversispora eburnea]